MNKKYLVILANLIIFSNCGGSGGGGNGAGTSQSAAEQAAQFVHLDKTYSGIHNEKINFIHNQVLKIYDDKGETLTLQSNGKFELSYYLYKEADVSLILPITGTFEVQDPNKKIIKLNIDQISKCFPGETRYYVVNSNANLDEINDLELGIDLELDKNYFADTIVETNCNLTTSLKTQPE